MSKSYGPFTKEDTDFHIVDVRKPTPSADIPLPTVPRP